MQNILMEAAFQVLLGMGKHGIAAAPPPHPETVKTLNVFFLAFSEVTML